jgi:hypothetical protein
MRAGASVACIAIAALLVVPHGLGAQPVLRRAAPPGYTLELERAQLSGSRPPAQGFAIEAAGGIAGSLLGLSVVLLRKDDCDVEDLGCHVQNAFLGIALGTLGSAAGTYIAGHAFDARPSGAGATLGAVAGAAAGLGAWHLFTQELDLVNRTEAAVVVYAVTQGVMAALGSRLVRALE